MQILIELLAYILGAGVLTVLGVLAEYSGLQHLTGGEPILGLWFAGFGLILLYGGTYLLGYEKVLKESIRA
jgi:K+ transporter